MGEIIPKPIFVLCLGLHESMRQDIVQKAQLRANFDQIEFHPASYGPKIPTDQLVPDVIIIVMQPNDTVAAFGNRLARFHAAYPEAGLGIVVPDGINVDGVDAHIVIRESNLSSVSVAVSVLLPTEDGSPPLQVQG